MTHLDTKTMAEKVGTSESNVRTWARKFDIPIKKDGRKWLFPGDVVGVLQTIKTLKDSDCGYNTIQRRITTPEELLTSANINQLEQEKTLLQERISVSNERIQELEVICNMLQDQVELYNEHLATSYSQDTLSQERQLRQELESELEKAKRKLSLLPSREQIIMAFEDFQETRTRLEEMEQSTIPTSDYIQVQNHLLELEIENKSLKAQLLQLKIQENSNPDLRDVKEDLYRVNVELAQTKQAYNLMHEQQIKRTSLLSEAWQTIDRLKVALQKERNLKVEFAQTQVKNEALLNEKEQLLLQQQEYLKELAMELKQVRNQQECLVEQQHILEKKLAEANQKNEFLQIELNHSKLEAEKLQTTMKQTKRSLLGRFLYWLRN